MLQSNLRFDLDQVKEDEPISVKLFPEHEEGLNNPQSLNLFITPGPDPSIFLCIEKVKEFWKGQCVLLSIDELDNFISVLNEVKYKIHRGGY